VRINADYENLLKEKGEFFKCAPPLHKDKDFV